LPVKVLKFYKKARKCIKFHCSMRYLRLYWPECQDICTLTGYIIFVKWYTIFWNHKDRLLRMSSPVSQWIIQTSECQQFSCYWINWACIVCSQPARAYQLHCDRFRQGKHPMMAVCGRNM
jgi:hypothetical protein